MTVEYNNESKLKQRFYYDCSFNAGNYNNDNNYDIEEEIQDNNYFKYLIDLINYKIIFCGCCSQGIKTKGQ